MIRQAKKSIGAVCHICKEKVERLTFNGQPFICFGCKMKKRRDTAMMKKYGYTTVDENLKDLQYQRRNTVKEKLADDGTRRGENPGDAGKKL